MNRTEEALKIAKSLARVDEQLAELKAERERLMSEFATFVVPPVVDAVVKTSSGEETSSEETSSEGSQRRVGPRFGDSPARVLSFLAANPGTAFTPAEISRATGVDSKLVRNTLHRLSADDDGRIVKAGDRHYEFHSMTKKTAAA